MAIYSLRKRVSQMRAELREMRAAPSPLLARLSAEPTAIMTAAGVEPDEWQREVLESRSSRTILCCSRQRGKSAVAAALALREALLHPGALVLLFSPTLRQSSELHKGKIVPLYHALGRPIAMVQASACQMTLANGSRIISLPGDEEGVRGYSAARLIIIDEASRVPDALYLSVRPMLAVSKGKLLVLSTPFGQRGWFYEEWDKGTGWHKVKVTAEGCARISPEFLAEERRVLGPRWFAQEYQCSFEATTDSVFSPDDIRAAGLDAPEPLWSE